MVRFVVPAEHISRADEGTRTEETDQRNYFLKSQGLSIDGVDDVLWDHNLLGLGIEQQITQVFGDGSDRADQELLVFNSLLGFYDVPRPFLHALLHAALRLPTPLMEKAHDFITAMAHRGSERVPYVAIHLRRSKVFREHCRDVKERKVYASSEKIIDKSLVYDRCYTAMEDVIHRLKAIKEVGNYSCVFVATDLSPGDQEDILLRDFPWVRERAHMSGHNEWYWAVGGNWGANADRDCEAAQHAGVISGEVRPQPHGACGTCGLRSRGTLRG